MKKARGQAHTHKLKAKQSKAKQNPKKFLQFAEGRPKLDVGVCPRS